MPRSLRIAFIASECDPFIKTGGLADVIGSLPGALRRLGHEPVIIVPRYAGLNLERFRLRRAFDKLGVWMGNCLEWCAVDQTALDDIPAFFIESNKFFDRNGLYHDDTFRDYPDNAYRFGFFSRAALQLLIDLRQKIDVIHIHDWQTSSCAAYQKIWHWNNEILGNTASVLTIHNIAYQGVYPVDCYEYLGFQWGNFTSQKFEDHGRVNLLKGGIHYSDRITTVSQKHADEVRTPEYAYGMAPYLNIKAERFSGILNGIDYSIWNPEIDPLIPAVYSRFDMTGKATCKRNLQERMGLTVDATIPLIGVISRFASQKGLHLFAAAVSELMNEMIFQCVILGSGDPYLETFFRELPAQYPGRVASFIGFNNELAHWIEAGSDCFLMPSLYEPCGLNQLYSLKYGALPIVRATGGLDDSIDQYCERTGSGTGFKFFEPSPKALSNTVGWAVSTWYDRSGHFRQMQAAAMEKDFSWDVSAVAYEDVYFQALNDRMGSSGV
ncbi:glycogen synthase [bacterium]|nr:glycogen synthase [candidate division CSSED10-310 bacterium]